LAIPEFWQFWQFCQFWQFRDRPADAESTPDRDRDPTACATLQSLQQFDLRTAPGVVSVRDSPMTSGPISPLVLVVEDDQDTRDMYALFLDFSGMRVLTAASVDAAFGLAVEYQPDIVVTDFVLQGIATGADLCKRLHDDERTAHIPALLLTGSTRKQDAEAAIGAGCSEIRIKPYLPDALVSDILEIIARPRNERLAG
jgi:two-component system cell cycle response regulator DivK